MATLGDLKTRIADELTRDDMTSGGDSYSALTRAIDSAIDQSENELFYFNHANATLTTTSGSSSVATPSNIRLITQVSYLEYPLIHDTLEALQPLTETGIPSRWAMDGDTIYLWPKPDAAYSLSVQGTTKYGTPATDGASNVWTVQGYDLIAARAKKRLCRFPLRDTEGFQLASDEEAEALADLREETKRRRIRPLRADDVTVSTVRRYSINTDR